MENAVYQELRRSGRECFYWKGKNEVDFVFRGEKGLSGINVSYGSEIKDREVKGLIEFKDNFDEKVSELAIITKDIEKEEKGIRFVPLWKWLLMCV